MTPIVIADSHGVRRAVAGALGFGPADLTHGLDVDLPVRRPGPEVATVHDMAIFDVPVGVPTAPGRRRAAAGPHWRFVGPMPWWPYRRSPPSGSGPWLGRDAVVVHEAPARAWCRPRPTDVDRVRSRYGLPDAVRPPRREHRTPQGPGHVGRSLPPTRRPSGADRPQLVGQSAAAGVGHRDRSRADGATCLRCTVPPPLVGYASRYEGFGLPPVEAMACGAAVVSTPVPAVDEVVGSAVAVFAPGDVAGLVGVLGPLLADGDRRSELAARGAHAVETLSWERAARETAEVYRGLGLSL